MTQGWIFSLCLPRTSSAVESGTSFRLFARTSISLSGMQGAANFLLILFWNTSVVFGSLSFCRSNRMRGLFVKDLVFRINLMVVSTRSCLLPMSAPGKDLVFDFLLLDLKRWGVRMKSIWLWICPLAACQVFVPDNLWGWRVLARVNRLLYVNSRSLILLSFLSNAKSSNDTA